MENLTVKGIIYFLSLLAVSVWLLAHTGKLEGVVEKLVLLLMFLLSGGFVFVGRKDKIQLFPSFCEEEGHKTAVRFHHFYGHPLLPQSVKVAVCSCNIAPVFSLVLLSYQVCSSESTQVEPLFLLRVGK